MRHSSIFLVRMIAMLATTGALTLGTKVSAYDLFSTKDTYLGSGGFLGPGARKEEDPLFEAVIHDMVFVSPLDFVTPFRNYGSPDSTICAQQEVRSRKAGQLSDGTPINERVDTCSMTLDGTRLITAVVNGGPFAGQQRSVTIEDGNVIMSMDYALDLNIGEKGVIRLPFYGTTGSITVPYSLQTQAGGHGVDQAGKYPSGTVLTGRIGDFNEDGWIDGTLVATGVLPLDSPIYPGQPYVLYRNFETNIPIDGALAGNITGLRARKADTARR